MKIENLVTLAAALLAFVASVIATAVALYNARFRRFARERMWERKAEAYSRLIEALSSLVYYYEEHAEAASGDESLSDAYKKELQAHWTKGYAEVKRATATGGFLISNDAAAALERMWRERYKGVHPDDWVGVVEAHHKAARECLQALVAAAKRDLEQPGA
jgi:hypothetical protein